jgi:DNA invertase Pin-like site-specific DNA recombinase
MGTNEDRETLRASLRSWGKRQRTLAAERDPLVLASLDAGITKEEIHQATGLGRTTIDRIQKQGSESAS